MDFVNYGCYIWAFPLKSVIRPCVEHENDIYAFYNYTMLNANMSAATRICSPDVLIPKHLTLCLLWFRTYSLRFTQNLKEDPWKLKWPCWHPIDKFFLHVPNLILRGTICTTSKLSIAEVVCYWVYQIMFLRSIKYRIIVIIINNKNLVDSYWIINLVKESFSTYQKQTS